MKTWFKHYTSSHLGSSFAMMRANRDFETMACFWLLLELMGRHESTTSDGTMVIPKKLLQQTWNVQGQRLAKIISKFTLYFDKTILIESLDETYKVFVSKWPELQETRGGKRLAKKNQKFGRSKKEEVRSKKEEDKKAEDKTAAAEISDSEKHNSRKKKSPASQPVISYDEKLNPIAPELAARNVRSQMATQWVENFGTEIILEEFWKAVDWAENSGKVKSFGAFFSNWLKRTASAKKNEVVILPPRDLSNLKGWEE